MSHGIPTRDESRQWPRGSGTSLLSRCRDGDPEGWRELVGAYERLVFSIPRGYGLDTEDSADVTQATFAALLTGLGSIRDDDALVPWLGTVARRLTWRVIDRRCRERAAGGRGLEEETPTAQVEDPYEEWVQRAWLVQGLSRLDPGCRQLLTALYLDEADPSYRAVSARLGIAVGTIGPARGRCLRRLRAVMADQ